MGSLCPTLFLLSLLALGSIKAPSKFVLLLPCHFLKALCYWKQGGDTEGLIKMLTALMSSVVVLVPLLAALEVLCG